MSSRFLSNIALAVAAGFAVVVSLAWPASVFMWIMLGLGVFAVALTGTAVLRSRGPEQRSLDAIIGVLGVWTIVASLVFTASTVTWLGFASAVALVALALIGLALHELSTERVVHSLEVHARTPEVHGTAPEPEFASIR